MLEYLTIRELNARYVSGEITPQEVTEYFIERIERLDPQLGAFIALTSEIAIEQSRLLGDSTISKDNALFGVPFSLKDNIDVDGIPTTANSRLFRYNIASADSAAYRAVRSHGAVLLGKNTLRELACGNSSLDLPWGPALNPWDVSRNPGSSSSGSAVAVAAGLSYFSIGTDTGGSIRHPATACGIVGLKPTYGLLDTTGIIPLAASLDHVGPLARTVEDAFIAFMGLGGIKSLARKAHVEMNNFADCLDVINREPAGMKVGYIEHWNGEFGPSPDPEMIRNLETTLLGLEHLGVNIVPLKLRSIWDFIEVQQGIIQYEAYQLHKKNLITRSEEFGDVTREQLLRGKKIPATTYRALGAQQEKITQELQTIFIEQQLDAVISLSSLDLPGRFTLPEEMDATFARHCRAPFNVTGFPALSVPTGFSTFGLPTGIQIAGRYFSELILVKLGRAIESFTEKRHPLI